MRLLFCLTVVAVLLGCGLSRPVPQKPRGKQPPPHAEANRAAAAFSPDGRWLLTEFVQDNFSRAKGVPPYWNEVMLWKVATGRAVKTFPTAYRGSAFGSVLAFLPDGKHAFSGGDGHWRVFEVPSGTIVREVKNYPWTFYPLALSGNGKRLITFGDPGDAQGIQLWDVDTGKIIKHYPIGNVGWACASHDGQLAMLAGGFVNKRGEPIPLQLWNFGRGRPILSLTRSEGWNPFAFSPDNKYYVAGRSDKNEGHLYLCNSSTGLAVRQMGNALTPGMLGTLTVAFTADGQHVLLAGDYRLTRIAVADGKTVWSVPIEKGVNSAAFTPDGATALTVRGSMIALKEERMTFTLWDTVRGERLRELALPE